MEICESVTSVIILTDRQTESNMQKRCVDGQKCGSLAEKKEPQTELRMTENNKRRGEERRAGEKEK